MEKGGKSKRRATQKNIKGRRRKLQPSRASHLQAAGCFPCWGVLLGAGSLLLSEHSLDSHLVFAFSDLFYLFNLMICPYCHPL